MAHTNGHSGKPNVYMPWYIGDYLRDTMHLDTTQHGAYLLLLANYWTRQGPLPDDDQFLAGITKLPMRAWRAIRPVLAQFFEIKDGTWHQKRADHEISIAGTRKERARIGASKTNERRWGTRRHATISRTDSESLIGRLAIAQRPLCDTQSGRTSPSPSTSDTDPPSPPGSNPTPEASVRLGGEAASRELLQAIEAVWAIWPKKVDTMQALQAIGDAIGRDGFDRVAQGTQAIVGADARRRATPPGRYLPRPTEFFEGSRYLDDPAQYGPREEVADPATLRKILAEKRAAAATHPGNPESPTGSLERKRSARPEYERLLEEIKTVQRALAAVTTDEDEGREGGAS